MVMARGIIKNACWREGERGRREVVLGWVCRSVQADQNKVGAIMNAAGNTLLECHFLGYRTDPDEQR